jgi:hypothetical protein
MKNLIVSLIVTTCSPQLFATTEKSCRISGSRYETLQFKFEDSPVPAIVLGEKNATFSVNSEAILSFGESFAANLCKVALTVNNEEVLIADWSCTPAIGSDRYFAFIRFILYKNEQSGHLHFGFTDVRHYGGPERHLDFSCK